MIVNEEAVKKILEEVKPAKLVAATKYVDVHEIEKLEELGEHVLVKTEYKPF